MQWRFTMLSRRIPNRTHYIQKGFSRFCVSGSSRPRITRSQPKAWLGWIGRKRNEEVLLLLVCWNLGSLLAFGRIVRQGKTLAAKAYHASIVECEMPTRHCRQEFELSKLGRLWFRHDPKGLVAVLLHSLFPELAIGILFPIPRRDWWCYIV